MLAMVLELATTQAQATTEAAGFKPMALVTKKLTRLSNPMRMA